MFQFNQLLPMMAGGKSVRWTVLPVDWLGLDKNRIGSLINFTSVVVALD